MFAHLFMALCRYPITPEIQPEYVSAALHIDKLAKEWRKSPFCFFFLISYHSKSMYISLLSCFHPL